MTFNPKAIADEVDVIIDGMPLWKRETIELRQ